MFTSNDDDVALTTIARSVGEGLEDSFLETRELGVVCLWNSPVPSLLPLFLSPIPQYYSAMLNLADLTHGLTFSSHSRSHPKAAVDLTFFLLLFIHLSLCLSLVVGIFFFPTIWVDLILVSNCGGWFAVEVGCSGGDGGF